MKNKASVATKNLQLVKVKSHRVYEMKTKFYLVLNISAALLNIWINIRKLY